MANQGLNFICGKGHLVFAPPDPLVIKAVFPDAKWVDYKGQPQVVLPHTIDAVTILRNLGMEAPSPINIGWSYPGMFKPWRHQKKTSEFLTVNRRGFVLSGLGSGKSASAIWAAEYLMQHGIVRRALIVCPKSCMQKVWGDELFRTAPGRPYVILEGSRERKRSLYESAADVVVVNHDGMVSLQDLICRDPRLDLIIYDEASALRNAATNRYKAVKAACKPSTRLWLMTATPCPNAPTDAWALARLVRPETVPQYFGSFKRQTMMQVSNFKWVPKPGSAKVAYDVLQPAIRYRTEDCIDLPPVTHQDRVCTLSAEQRVMIKSMAKSFAANKGGATITAANAAVMMMKIMQLAGGVVYDDSGAAALVDPGDRLAVVQEIVDEADRKVIIWCPFKHAMELIKTTLNDAAGYTQAEIINGDVSGPERARIITEFTDESHPLKVLVAHPATAAHGLTLVSANISVWYGPTFSAELKAQADGRIVRPGQKHHMTIIHIGATKLEWEAYGVANDKMDRQEKILSMYRNLLDNPL